VSLEIRKVGSIWWLWGTLNGERIRRTTKTSVRAQAEEIKSKLERETHQRKVFGEASVATFREAATGYLKSGGSPLHIKALVDEIGDRRLIDISQGLVDDTAQKMKPKAAPATLIRQIYTPVLAVMNYAAADSLCPPIKLKKPKVRNKRTDWLTPEEAEQWIEAVAHHPRLQSIVIFFLGTGCRASEGVNLIWRNVMPNNTRAILWDDETKGGYARHVDLQQRVRSALPKARGKPEAQVFLSSYGDPWHKYDAINLALKRVKARRDKAIKGGADLPELRHAHLHLFRHTWATWAYAVTHDLTFLMAQGGWREVTMVMRYTHMGTPELADDVQAHGWTIWPPEVVAKRAAKKAAAAKPRARKKAVETADA
jgi:integrase